MPAPTSADSSTGCLARLCASDLRVHLKAASPWIVIGFCWLLFAATAQGGWVEGRGGKTIIHVKVFGLPDPSYTDAQSRAAAAGVKAFKDGFAEMFARKYRARYQANPLKYGNHNWNDVEVELERFSGIEVEGVETDLLAIAGDLAADVLYVNFRKSDNYIQNGFLYPLDKPEDGYMSGPGSMTQEEKDFRIHPKIWPVIDRVGPDGQRHIWAMPFGGALGKVMLYRKDLFDAYGVAYPTKDWTWEDMFAAAKKLTDPKAGTFGIQFGRGKWESWHWITFLWSAGGEVMEYDPATDQWRSTFDSYAAAKALDFYIRLSAEKWTDSEGNIRRGYAAKGSAEAKNKWDLGQIGMFMSYIDEKLFSTINPEITGMAPVPLGPPNAQGQRMRGAELNSRMMGLFAKIKEPAVRDAAWEYMRFYDSKEAMAIKTKIMVEGGLGRFINPRYLRMFGYSEIERLSPKGWAETFEIAIATGKPEPYGRNSNYAYHLMSKPIHKAERQLLAGNLPEDEQERIEVLHDILVQANADANEEMIGIISPRERMFRRIGAALMLMVIGGTFFFVFRMIFRVFTPPAEGEGKQVTWGFRKYYWAYVLLLPAALTILIWQYIPLARGSVMAFMDYRIIGDSTWVGLDNFGDLLWDWNWWMSVWNALRYCLLVMSLTFLPPIILAILLQEVPRFKIIFRTIYYLPAVITGLVVMLLWKQFYDNSDTGVLNSLVLKVPAICFIGMGLVLFALAFIFTKRLWHHGIKPAAWGFFIAGAILFGTCAALALPILFPATDESLWHSLRMLLPQITGGHWHWRLFATTSEPYRWLDDSRTAMIACVVPMVWAGMGPGCLIYLAALKGIADDYYEAADIDGATFVDKILFVVFPILKPLILINFIGVFVGAWYGATGNILAMTGGGANTEVAGLHIWYKAFGFLKFGPATAMAWMLGFMLIGFTVYQLRILSRLEFRTTGDK